MQKDHNIQGRNRGRQNHSSSILSFILILLICITIAAFLCLGGLIARRMMGQQPTPEITDPVTSAPPVDTDGSNSVTDQLTTDVPTSVDTPPVTTAPVTEPPVTDTPATDAPATEPITSAPPAVDEPDYSVFLKETPDAGKDYLDKIVFMGDSTTYGLHVYSDLYPRQIWTPASGTMDLFDMTNKSIALPTDAHRSEWKEVRIADALSTVKPEILIVTLGVNYSTDFSNWTDERKEEYFKLQIENIINLVKTNSPDTKLIFQSIYPVIDSVLVSKGSGIRQSRIDTRNSWLYQTCEKHGIPVLKTEDILKDANGQLKVEYNTYHLDGIHLNPPAFEAVLKYVKTHSISN